MLMSKYTKLVGLKLTRKPAGAGIYVFTHPLRRLNTDAAEEINEREMRSRPEPVGGSEEPTVL
jgi:hypothetical protein